CTAAEAHTRQAAVRLTLHSGGSARGMISAADEHGLLLVHAAVDDERPRERAVAWSAIRRIEVARPANNPLLLGYLLSFFAAYLTVGPGNSRH
ncbi:MAG: hypothetical protein ACYDIE_04415, partial [Candidatus Krumholzibacteriia bacterium]